MEKLTDLEKLEMLKGFNETLSALNYENNVILLIWGTYLVLYQLGLEWNYEKQTETDAENYAKADA